MHVSWRYLSQESADIGGKAKLLPCIYLDKAFLLIP